MVIPPIGIRLRPARICRGLLLCVAGLTLLSLSGQAFKHLGGHDHVFGLVALFDVNAEANVPTSFSAGLHLVAAFLLGLRAAAASAARERFRRHWAVLAAGFVYLAFDEAGKVHELLCAPMKQLLGARASGVLFLAWVVPAAVAVLVVGLAYVRFLAHLPGATRTRFLVAGAVFVGGAIGGELAGGAYAERHGFANLSWNLIGTVEEAMEMIGMILFIGALADHIGSRTSQVVLDFDLVPAPAGSPRSRPAQVSRSPA